MVDQLHTRITCFTASSAVTRAAMDDATVVDFIGDVSNTEVAMDALRANGQPPVLHHPNTPGNAAVSSVGCCESHEIRREEKKW